MNKTITRIGLLAFILVIVLIVSAIVVLRIKNEKSKTETTNKQEKVVTNNAVKSVCTEQLSSQPITAVTKFEGVPSQVDFTTLPEAKMFYTSITKTVALGSNFAGHFTLVSWGCGTDCVGYAVINTINGEIIAYSPANGDYHLGNFTLDDNFFILNPVHAGQERKFNKVVDGQDNNSRLELVCTEISSKEMYGLPE